MAQLKATQTEVAQAVLNKIAGLSGPPSALRQQGRGVTVFVDPGGHPRVEVEDYATLIRVIGLIRYTWNERILLYRGQTQCYGNMTPSAYRDDRVAGRIGRTARNVDTAVRRLLAAVHQAQPNGEGASVVHRAATEPALQHYGLHTRWMDVVDSVPHAVFFAANAQMGLGSGGPFTYVPWNGSQGVIYLFDLGADAERRPVYVSAAGTRHRVPGLWNVRGGTRLCDLRRAKPSNASRPHAQHGFLFRSEGETDLWSRVVARIFVPTAHAAAWVAGGALSLRELFPEDDGFMRGLLAESVRLGIHRAEAESGFGLGEVQRFAHHKGQ